MNKKLLITAGIVVAVLALGIAYAVGNKMMQTPAAPALTQENPAQVTMEPVQNPAQQPVAEPVPGAYKVYNATEVASAKGIKILFFHAQWCPQCRQLDGEIKAGPLPQNVTIFKVNYDTSQELRQKYGVTLQTTFVKIDDSGALVKKYVAYDEPTLAALIRDLL